MHHVSINRYQNDSICRSHLRTINLLRGLATERLAGSKGKKNEKR